jgi:hypothetical protein
MGMRKRTNLNLDNEDQVAIALICTLVHTVPLYAIISE